jgi:hypothetical protein
MRLHAVMPTAGGSRLCAAALLFALGGCGLIADDVADFALQLPDKKVVLDTAEWALVGTNEFPAVSCVDDESICSSGNNTFCSAEVCSGSCDGANCRATVVIALWHTIDLQKNNPELSSLDGKPLVSVSVDRVLFDIGENTLSTATPPLTLYVGPKIIMKGSDMLADPVGTIDPVQVGATGIVEVKVSESGRDSMRRYMKDYATPFNLVVGGTTEFGAGDPLPDGILAGVVRVTATARPGL